MRLLVVSNRLPITAVEEDGKLKFKESVGGLVSGVSAYLDSLKGSGFTQSDYIWVGWPGLTVEGEKREELQSHALEFKAHPVFLPEEAMEKFYLGFCNKTIWPLFHYFPTYAVYDWDYWNQYKLVNQAFCDAILEILKPDDVVWVHDYHLMLLPRMLRERVPDNPLGFFLHIPFPSYEVFRLLPAAWRRDLLLGLLGADLLGFHTHDYTEYFLRCVLRVLGHEHNLGKLLVEGRVKKAETFPMGIDYDKFQKIAQSSDAQKARNRFRKDVADVKLVLSVDRLDYSKGVIHRLQGFERFLEKNPAWHEKVTLSMVVVPSRIGVEHYQETKSQIDGLVGKINGRFGTLHWTPILYQYKFLPLSSLVPLYAASDVALVTPLRDGMNLVAKEYIASRTDQTGVLILSEMVGAAKELGEAIMVNPNHPEEIASALKEALEMPRDEQIRRNKMMQTRLKQYNVVRWANDFIQTLVQVRGEQEKFDARYLGSSARQNLLADFERARHRLFLLDYDGTLVPFAQQPQMAKPTKALVQTLTALAADPRNQVVITSGRDRETLQNWFGALNVDLVAEQGAWIADRGRVWRMAKPLKNDWKAQLLPILQRYADRLPGSFVEEKEFSIAWHYRQADLELGAARAKELVDDLVHFTANSDVQVLSGSRLVEVTSSSLGKGAAVTDWLSDPGIEFIMAAGNDGTDEQVFQILPPTAYSIKVGMTPSHAKYYLLGPDELVGVLKDLAVDHLTLSAVDQSQSWWNLLAALVLK